VQGITQFIAEFRRSDSVRTDVAGLCPPPTPPPRSAIATSKALGFRV